MVVVVGLGMVGAEMVGLLGGGGGGRGAAKAVRGRGACMVVVVAHLAIWPSGQGGWWRW